jgi:2-polyprenyl-3-methyl-5-hydroxy-6-metoxy-1,4-benzoquinol methylase
MTVTQNRTETHDLTPIERQARYWNDESQAFDAIYSHRKSALSNWLDRVFRRDMYERFRFAVERSQPIVGRTVLDLGCGSGRYVVALAEAGASRVLGIDIAPRMLELARELAAEHGVADRCEFQLTDVLGLDAGAGPGFDVVLAIGLFDYIRDPAPVLSKIRALTAGRAIISFPRLLTWRALPRKLRLALRGCEVHFYSRAAILRLLNETGFSWQEIRRVGKLDCVVAVPGVVASGRQDPALVTSPSQ